jgi:EpsI family protein
MRIPWRFLVAAGLLAGTALLLHARQGSEVIPARTPLASFPHDFDGWTSTDVPMTEDTLAVLGPGDFLLRDYQSRALDSEIALFIAYFPSQRAGDTIHSPKNCLPGAGWAPVRADRIMMTLPGRVPFQVNRYVIAKGDEQQLVLYWYWAHNRAVASEYAAKFYLVADSIRMRRSDGSLIRLSMPLSSAHNMVSAQQTLTTFADNIVSRIDSYVPR